MTGLRGTDFIVGGIATISARITHRGFQYSPDSLEVILHSPETSGREYGPLHLLHGNEIHGDGIDAMAGVPGRKTLSFKHVPQVATAGVTDNLRSHPIRVRFPLQRIGDRPIKTGPAAMRVKLILGTEQGFITIPACIKTLFGVVNETPRPGGFRLSLQNHRFLHGVQFICFHVHFFLLPRTIQRGGKQGHKQQEREYGNKTRPHQEGISIQDTLHCFLLSPHPHYVIFLVTFQPATLGNFRPRCFVYQG